MREIHIVGPKSREWIIPARPELADAGMFMAGISHADSRFRFVRVSALYPQILISLAGNGEVWLAGKWQACPAGSAYVTPAGRYHAYRSTGPVPWKVAWILYLSGTKCPISTPEPLMLKLDPRPLRDAIRGLYRETISRGSPAMMKSWIELMELYTDRVLRDSSAGDTLWPVWNIVAANLSRKWTLKSLAKAASISSEHLRRLCHRQLGCTPMQHVTRLRMHRAATLLTASPQKMEAIAAAIGYANRFAFSQAFRRHLNQTPGSYRRGLAE